MTGHDIARVLADASDHDLELALTLARQAGEVLLEQAVPWTRRAMDVRAKSSATDAVTEMDLQAEALIRAGLVESRPDDGILGEEGGGSGSGAARTWVVDPLDGTVNYLYGLPHWAVSIALVGPEGARVGVVHVPVQGETFVAVAGAGAVLLGPREGEPVRLGGPAAKELAESLVATGFGYAAERRARQADVLTRVLPRVRDIRRLGAAAIDLCHAAAGRVDAFYEMGLQPWDVAAGELIAREAGLSVEEVPQSGDDPPLVLAGPPATVAELRLLLE